MKGILLAGGSGTRLAPLTNAISKQLLPIYDKPTIYYSLSVLMMAGLREILIISTPRDVPRIEEVLGNGDSLGISLKYQVQTAPRGIAEALILGESFFKGGPVALILGDNIFYGNNLGDHLQESVQLKSGARVFAYYVSDPERYGVVNLDRTGKALEIEEKPKNPKSNWAVTGLYFYDEHAGEYARGLTPSARGELEITDLNKTYLKKGQLEVTCLHRGMAWLDTGTFDSLLSSSQFVQTLEKRQGLKIACIEEIALKMGFINSSQFAKLVVRYEKSEYGLYLKQVLQELDA